MAWHAGVCALLWEERNNNLFSGVEQDNKMFGILLDSMFLFRHHPIPFTIVL